MKVGFATHMPLTESLAPPARLINLARVAGKKGFDVTLFGSDAGPVEGKFGIARVGKSRLGSFGNRLNVARKVVSSKLDAVVVREAMLGTIIGLLSKVFGFRMILDFHGMTYKELLTSSGRIKAAIFGIFDYLSIYLADDILVISEGVRDMLPESKKEKALLLPNGVKLEEFAKSKLSRAEVCEQLGLDKDLDYIAFVGNWGDWFNMNDLVESWHYLDKDIGILVIGAGYDIDKLKEEYFDKQRVYLVGKQPHELVVPVMKELAFACAVPYRDMGLASGTRNFFASKKIREYMAAGKPIIMSDVDTRDRSLEDRKNIIIYKPGNPDDFAKKANMLHKDKKLQKTMSEANVKDAKGYSWKALFEKSGLETLLSD